MTRYPSDNVYKNFQALDDDPDAIVASLAIPVAAVAAQNAFACSSLLEPDTTSPPLNQQVSHYDPGTEEDIFEPTVQFEESSEPTQTSKDRAALRRQVWDGSAIKKRKPRVEKGQKILNNLSTGRGGMKRCLPCRKHRQKCVFDLDHEDEPCLRCIKRNIECGEKVWGPEKDRKLNPELWEENEEVDDEVELEVIWSPAALALFRDSNLNQRDRGYLKALYKEYADPTRRECVAVVLQNLWEAYGLTFNDETLLYSILAWQSSFNFESISPRQRVADHEGYKNKFKMALVKSVSEGSASEPHFFAALFAVLTSFHEIKGENAERTLREFNGENPELRTFQQIMLVLLKKLNEMEAVHESPELRKLQFLYNYVLSLVRLWASESATAAINYDMHIVTEKIPMPKDANFDWRARYTLPAQYFLRQDLTPDWQGIEMSLSDDIRALFSCFQKMLSLNREEQEENSPANSLLKTSLKVLRSKALKMQELPAIQAVMKRIQEPDGPVQPHVFSTDPFYTYFLASLFRIQALISVMQFAHSGQTNNNAPDLVRQVFQAEYTYYLHDDELWGRSHASLYTSMGLLLNQAFGFSTKELKSQRRWLSDAWRWQYLTKTPCTRCPSKPLARIQRFWRSEMGRADYIEFLQNNLWIWREIPMDVSERNLELNEYERNRDPCIFCGRI